ncbi:hypothetical protein CEP51_005999 [Fusarium floridanum]|uniref:RING-type E3 ubiquitin transferase n=1 Tax=Fusarium floridanum TaxID=1325733 RepID=A0A428RUF7_9HYPO|nr:hypothetical protein CEP51_005999 [Fusarium floridanum]
MRPPRVFVLILFIAVSLLLFCRAISSSLRSAYADYPAGGFSSGSKAAQSSQSSHETTKSTKSVWGSMYYNTPFSLFPPNAAISLTDDNSTSFAARPAAFGPKLAIRGLSGQLWIGSGFAEDSLLDGTGELGCGDLPGWNKGAEAVGLNRALRAAVPSVAAPRSDASTHSKRGDQVFTRNERNHITSPSEFTNGQRGRSRNQDASDIKGKVVLLMRGGCGFLDKVMWAQRRGAIAVIVGDNQKGGPLIQMFAHGPEVDNVTIPSVFTARTTAQLLSALTQPGSFIEDTLDNQGNPVLRVQQGPRPRKHKTQRPRSSVTASTRERRSLVSSQVSGRFSRFITRRQQAPSNFAREFEDETTQAFRNTLRKRAVKDTRSPLLSEDYDDGWKPKDESETLDSASVRKIPVSRHGSEPSDSTADAQLLKFFSETEEEDEPSAPIDRPDDRLERPDEVHEGLWVTITPTSNASPFFDTLLVLVISPLVTLTVVYALLILRARIRRRRWRAPKSVVERLPVRTYHTVATSPSLSPRAPSPASASPTTPLLQETPTRPRPRSRTTTGVPEDESRVASSEAIPTPSTSTRNNNRRNEREKGSSGFSAEWKKYMGRQVECVVCLEEYVDGVSQVMSLPCGHEFHVECITPWLTTRRRTCPICKGDVVRSLAHGSSSEPHYEPYRDDDSDDEETIAEGSGSRSDDRESDLEQGLLSTEPRSSRWSRHDGWLSLFSSGAGRARSPSPEDRDR